MKRFRRFLLWILNRDVVRGECEYIYVHDLDGFYKIMCRETFGHIDEPTKTRMLK